MSRHNYWNWSININAGPGIVVTDIYTQTDRLTAITLAHALRVNCSKVPTGGLAEFEHGIATLFRAGEAL